MSMQKPTIHKPALLLSSLVISITLAGCATTATTVRHEDDPWAGWNRGTQAFNDHVDKAILKPLAKGYEWITPEFVSEGITNIFSNINDIGVTINDLLQFKLAQSGMDGSRFLINTTAGVAGFFDVAKLIDLPKHKEDFGQTLGYWGVPSGNYLVLPLFGPSSPRDTFGLVGDALLNPLTYVSFGAGAAAAATAGAKTVDVVDRRANLMTTEKIVDEGSVDRYDFIKNSYEQNRDYLIHDGNPPDAADPDLFDDAIQINSGVNNKGKGSTESTSAIKGGNSINNPNASKSPSGDKKPNHMLQLLEPK